MKIARYAVVSVVLALMLAWQVCHEVRLQKCCKCPAAKCCQGKKCCQVNAVSCDCEDCDCCGACRKWVE